MMSYEVRILAFDAFFCLRREVVFREKEEGLRQSEIWCSPSLSCLIEISAELTSSYLG